MGNDCTVYPYLSELKMLKWRDDGKISPQKLMAHEAQNASFRIALMWEKTYKIICIFLGAPWNLWNSCNYTKHPTHLHYFNCTPHFLVVWITVKREKMIPQLAQIPISMVRNFYFSLPTSFSIIPTD